MRLGPDEEAEIRREFRRPTNPPQAEPRARLKTPARHQVGIIRKGEAESVGRQSRWRRSLMNWGAIRCGGDRRPRSCCGVTSGWGRGRMIGRQFRTAVLVMVAAAGAAACDRLGGPEAKLDKIDAQQKTCVETAAGDPTALIACHQAATSAAGKLAGRSRDAAFRALLSDMFEPLLMARTGGGDALAERVTVSAAFADLAQRRAAILTGAATGKGPEGTVRPFAGWPETVAGRGFAARWTTIRTADCAAYNVRNCARRMDAAMRKTVRELAPTARKRAASRRE